MEKSYRGQRTPECIFKFSPSTSQFSAQVAVSPFLFYLNFLIIYWCAFILSKRRHCGFYSVINASVVNIMFSFYLLFQLFLC